MTTAAVLTTTVGLSSVRGDQVAARAAVVPVKIVALGDSLTSGHRLPRADAYPALLESSLKENGIAAMVSNHGVSGDTSAGGLRRLPAALDEHPDVLIVALGINDGLRGLPVSQVQRNLAQIIEGAQARGATVLLCAMDALPLHGWQYTVDFHNMYASLAEKYKVPLVPFLLLNVFGNPELMTEDGVHPNAAGARAMAATILPYLLPLTTPGPTTR